jgi:DNA-binding response OmpR family regulator
LRAGEEGNRTVAPNSSRGEAAGTVPGDGFPGPEHAMKKVLAVDDQPQIVRLIQVNLQKADFEVITAFDGDEALHKLREHRPDLVILDVIMPKRDGFEVLREIKSNAETRHIPVIMLTVKAQDADIFEGLKEGAELYLPKPFHPTDLVSLVRRVLENQEKNAAAV